MKTHYNKPVSTLACAYQNGKRFAVFHADLGWETFSTLPWNADTRSAFVINRDGSLGQLPDEYSQTMQDKGISS